MTHIAELCTLMPPPPVDRDLADLHAIEVNPANQPPIDPLTAAKEGALHTSRCWPCGAKLRVAFLAGERAVQERVAAIAQEWTRYANLTFDFTDDPEAEIRVTFDPRAGSWSYLGTDSTLPGLRGRASMNLGWLTPHTGLTEYRRVVLHEFGHALGLIHEHLSPAARIPWDAAAVLRFYRETNGWSDEYTRSNVLEPMAVDRSTRFDPQSIMLYPVPAELLTDPAAAVPWSNSELSDLDKAFIRTIYPFTIE
jgi:hypothetical protein